MKLRLVDITENYLFVAPALIIFSIFYIIPFIWVFQLGLYEWDGILPTRTFVGLRNFIEIFTQDKIWWQSMGNAGYITLIALIFQNMLAFLLAWACDREMRLKNFYRVIFFIPPVLSEVVVGLVWQWILDGHYGFLNKWLVAAGFSHLARNWLSDPATALTTVAIVHSWKGFGWGFFDFPGRAADNPKGALRGSPGGRGKRLAFLPAHYSAADGSGYGFGCHTYCVRHDAGICFDYRDDRRRPGLSYPGAGVEDTRLNAGFFPVRLRLRPGHKFWVYSSSNFFYTIPVFP